MLKPIILSKVTCFFLLRVERVNNDWFFFPVADIKFEKIVPKIDGDSWDAAKEFRFLIPPTSEYFTRQAVLKSLIPLAPFLT